MTANYNETLRIDLAAEQIWRLLVLTKDGTPIAGDSGTIATISLAVADTFLTDGQLHIVNTIGSNGTRKIALPKYSVGILSLDAVNERVYESLSAQVAEVRATLDSVRAMIVTDCKDVAADYIPYADSLCLQLDSVQTTLEISYSRVELTEESTVDLADIIAAVEQLKSDALAAQEEYDNVLNAIFAVGVDSKYLHPISDVFGRSVSHPRSGRIYIYRHGDGRTIKRVAK